MVHFKQAEATFAEKLLGEAIPPGYRRNHEPSDDPKIQALIESVLRDGFVVIPNAFPAADIDAATEEVSRLATEQNGPAALGGRNPFEGYKTHRIYNLLDRSRKFDKFILHPAVLALNDYFLEPSYLLNTVQGISIQPGEDPQALHYDDATINVPRPRAPFGTAIMVALDPYTPTNGATVAIPGSHLWDSSRFPQRSEAIPITMPRGSIMFFLSTLWHGGGMNTTDRERRAMTVQYCQPWIRPLENMTLAVSWDKLEEIPEGIVDMMGWKVGYPFIGYVDGRSPRKAARGMVERMLKVYGGKEKDLAKL
jgi:ectoine hydroxylase-related dioxygenase (phytanoyl-CoA dioxygenase family)